MSKPPPAQLQSMHVQDAPCRWWSAWPAGSSRAWPCAWRLSAVCAVSARPLPASRCWTWTPPSGVGTATGWCHDHHSLPPGASQPHRRRRAEARTRQNVTQCRPPGEAAWRHPAATLGRTGALVPVAVALWASCAPGLPRAPCYTSAECTLWKTCVGRGPGDDCVKSDWAAHIFCCVCPCPGLCGKANEKLTGVPFFGASG
jgi:hypothetical protein